MENKSGALPLICFFDSGIGGINLLHECVNILPAAEYFYFADNFNVPYGSLPREKIIEKADGVFAEISKLKPSAAVIACNTVTAVCAEYLRSKYTFPIIGIQPAVKPAAERHASCVVLATPATAQSPSLKQLIARYGNGRVSVASCNDLAAYIEKNVFNLDEDKIFALLPQFKAEGVVLGCTHYAFIKDTVQKKYGCPVYDGLQGTAKRLCSVLGINNHLESKNGVNAASMRPQVSFIGGDTQKNKRVFTFLSENKAP